MCNAFVSVLGVITSIDWLEVMKALAAVATALIAYFALRNWQRQDKAKREAEFLDTMIEATHTFITEISKPTLLLEMAKIGIASHRPVEDNDDEADKAVKGAIAFIQKNGDRNAKRLLSALEAVEPSAINLKSLATRGQVFKFDDYAICQRAITLLIWQLDRIAAFTAIIGSSTWNWEHPEVQKSLNDVMAIEPDDIRKNLTDNNVVVLEFARDTYKRIYG